jgi:defect-in-organelle-trafficking protein DotD
MGGFIDIDWTGPVGPFVEKIAKMTGYRVKTLGNEPAIPVVVSLTVKHAIIAEVLQNASFQAGRRVNILVFPSNRVIEVRYAQ